MIIAAAILLLIMHGLLASVLDNARPLLQAQRKCRVLHLTPASSRISAESRASVVRDRSYLR
jgi:hypothetical protein